MMLKSLIILLFTFGLTNSVLAQAADDYFHQGGQAYIHSNIQDAINRVQDGLRQFPDDPKLNELLQRLEEEQQKQQQQQNQEQQQDQQQQQNQDQQDQEQEQEQNQEQQQQDQQSEEGDESQEQNPQEQQQAQGMTKENAEKILQALAQKEKELLKEFKKKNKQGSAKHEKDW